MTTWYGILQRHRAIAVIRAFDFDRGVCMAKAVAAAGMRPIEISWSSDRAADLVEKLRSELPECTIGAGTLFDRDRVKEAIAAGAQFLFSPHTDPEMIRTALDADVPMVPGALSPTEIVTAWHAGASAVKVFPISAVGGVSYIRSLQGPLGHIPLIPTGGITPDNAKAAIEAGALAVGLGSSLFPKSYVEAEDWDGITAIARKLRFDSSDRSDE
ncbi:MAG TPA: bifunctional 4-hydroxy-2-oxoglutarate aldolase/2-dehydro-3-deoxy-phosphogluconate aldolase [Oscillatoriales cyanobacterium M59_W2019_021]|nr:MAG: bifunctional 4-hydroxy-2-oxoglutarate aldolase/2-dehydro-3-deoxy-phosphogluconate aldolase [Cyanobacteria bacterium J055]HIK30345.1 bifunctional 4-hydroxy-2-oxoglutarate aldolase/2-dehydro-3-deoxy-phosphogluconate aldolase [Oscillatoriales cyanobacterium M4454_W2019_049]HIK49589.1 bifunctional 4-hydroxy-2-oxoglutarate aldolase/2-dehydro-3-deoxy-phosphogluconate aldolase [Oscillatoriales cyanobacterium M59_W2019_021]